MGRVSKYKKIKAIDPYSKQNKHHIQKNKSLLLGSCREEGELRQKKLEKRIQKQLQRRRSSKAKKSRTGDKSTFFDLPPDDIEDEFDLSTLTVRRNENTSQNLKTQTREIVGSSSHIPLQHAKQTFVGEEANRELQQELKTSRLLKIGSISKQSSYKNEDRTTQKVHGRLEGESMKAFTRRINQETAMILKESLTQQNGGVSRLKQMNPMKYEKKIQHLNKKKEKKRQMATLLVKQQRLSMEHEGASTDETLITGEYASRQAASLLHDQVERPPTFSVLPRGAKLLPSKSNNKDGFLSNVKSSNISKELEQYRARVQAQYALIKERKRSTL